MDLIKLTEQKVEKVGTWNAKDGLNVTKRKAFVKDKSPNVTLIVTTIEVRHTLHSLTFL